MTTATPDVRIEYDDGDITFYLQVYRDSWDAETCLTELRRHYPSSRVIMISDGDDDRRFARLAERFGAKYTAGERLYGIEHGGKMIQRMFDAFLTRPSDYLFKIDTDTRIHRRFRYLPTGCAVFGTLEWQTAVTSTKLDFPSIQGGCTGFTLEAARRVAESGLLLSDELLDYRGTYADNRDVIRRAENRGIISTDFVTRYACRRLEIPLVEFDEVRSLYRGQIASDGDGFAVTHPHKTEGRGLWKRIIRGVRKRWAAWKESHELTK